MFLPLSLIVTLAVRRPSQVDAAALSPFFRLTGRLSSIQLTVRKPKIVNPSPRLGFCRNKPPLLIRLFSVPEEIEESNR